MLRINLIPGRNGSEANDVFRFSVEFMMDTRRALEVSIWASYFYMWFITDGSSL